MNHRSTFCFHKALLNRHHTRAQINWYWRKWQINRQRALGTFFVLLSLLIMAVSAYVYESATQNVTQTIQDVATLTLNNAALGNIEEQETKSYTKTEVPALGNAITTVTYKANVFLHLNSDLDSLSTYYTNYTIAVKCATVPGGSSHTVGETVAIMTIASPDPAAVTLDVAGTWTFDFEITTTAKSVSSNQPTSATIVVTAEST